MELLRVSRHECPYNKLLRYWGEHGRFYQQWAETNSPQDAHFSFVDGVDDASEVKIMVEPAIVKSIWKSP